MRFILFLFFFLFSQAYAVDRDCSSFRAEKKLLLEMTNFEQSQELETLINAESFTDRFFLSAHFSDKTPSMLEITPTEPQNSNSFFSQHSFWLFSFFPFSSWTIPLSSENDFLFLPNPTSLIFALANIDFHGLLPKTITGLPLFTFDLLINQLQLCQPIDTQIDAQKEHVDFSLWWKSIDSPHNAEMIQNLGIPLSNDWLFISYDLSNLSSLNNKAPFSFQKMRPQETNSLNELQRSDYQCKDIKSTVRALNKELQTKLDSSSFDRFQTQKTTLFRHTSNLSNSFLSENYTLSYCNPLPDQRIVNISVFKDDLNNLNSFFEGLHNFNCLSNPSSEKTLSPEACSYLNFLFKLSAYYSQSL